MLGVFQIDKGPVCRDLIVLGNSLQELIKNSDDYFSTKHTSLEAVRRAYKDAQNCARDVCEALLMLHRNSLVHRDPRWDNIVQLGPDPFMLIDLETLAEADAALPEEFEGFTNWDELNLDEGK
ncbi:hypothetical protein COCSUDRAFT_39505 [Coccomyxa subellipsoidea C-169]|uniref:Protein kinase domain-containing protein n=1 Tax=Coccomyxa subellipsoidea (strain C-169) TaxID=574566 RepID=I0Z6X8_COCSC|nr:hypothetical protein COCSUDRAFT_39505 [Coccomyxa subellipsoidea C-169]EIE26397.1 hypothetical protein COCSUDRAFT_39505 [Coccomyxa subellipsoidea C-169]|eukprot:XP_005650941.1 hypothetical protein COCSUDRAFT_39505 [Coccomyxa subellipsoidea C-169]